jgi:predicted nucleic acid-binding protein
MVINPIIYAEVSAGYSAIEAVDAVLPAALYQREPLPWEAGFLAGKCFLLYRRRGGARTSPLPDFYIGAHAAIGRLALLTRDAIRYRSYFPKVEILAPPKHARRRGLPPPECPIPNVLTFSRTVLRPSAARPSFL